MSDEALSSSRDKEPLRWPSGFVRPHSQTSLLGLLVRDVPFDALDGATRVGCEAEYPPNRGALLPTQFQTLWTEDVNQLPELDEPLRLIMLNSWRGYLFTQKDDQASVHLRAMVAALIFGYRRGYTMEVESNELFRAVATLGAAYCALAAELVAWEAQSRMSSSYQDTELLYVSLLTVAIRGVTGELARRLRIAQQDGSKLHWCTERQCLQWRKACTSSGGMLDAIIELDSVLPHR